MAWLEQERGSFAPLMGYDLNDAPMGSLSVENSTWPQNPFHMPLEEAARIGGEFEDTGRVWLGYYNEPRLIYTAQRLPQGAVEGQQPAHRASGRRWLCPCGCTPLYAPLARRGLHAVEIPQRASPRLWRHHHPAPRDARRETRFTPSMAILTRSCCDRLKPGDTVARGEAFCRLGDPTQNGGWAPHVHFQAGDDHRRESRRTGPALVIRTRCICGTPLCPNPAALMNLPDDKDLLSAHRARARCLKGRRAHFGGNLSLTYSGIR